MRFRATPPSKNPSRASCQAKPPDAPSRGLHPSTRGEQGQTRLDHSQQAMARLVVQSDPRETPPFALTHVLPYVVPAVLVQSLQA